MNTLLRWDGSNDSSFLPKPVTNRLYAIASKMPSDVRLWLGSADNPRKLELKRIRRTRRVSSRAEVAFLQGRLGEVNWDKRTAQLHNYGGGYVRLRFNAALDEEMRLYGNQYVEVRGLGRFNAKDKWISVEVRELVGTRSGNQPFDLRAFLDDPNPRAFDPNNVVTASEPFDVDEFLRGIYEARDSGRQELSD